MRCELLPNLRKFQLQKSCKNACVDIDFSSSIGRQNYNKAMEDSVERDERENGVNNDEENTEVIVVTICGLNDWKSMFTEFPKGLGPVGFSKELGHFIEDIKKSGLVGT